MKRDHAHMGLSEIGNRLGVSRRRAHQLVQTYRDFPQPATVLAMGSVWHADDIEAWIQRHPDRKPGQGGHQPAPDPRRGGRVVSR